MATTIRVFRSTDTNGTNRTQVGGDFPNAVTDGQFSVGVPTTGWPAGTYYIQTNAEDVTDGKSVSVFSTPAQQLTVNAATSLGSAQAPVFDTPANNSGGTAAINFTPTAVGSLILVCAFGSDNDTSAWSVADSAAHTWATATAATFDNGTTRAVQAWWAFATTTSQITITLTGTPWYTHTLAVSELTGISSSTPFDTGIGASVISGDPVNTGTITTAQASEIIIGFVASGALTDFTAGTNFTKMGEFDSASSRTVALEYRVVSSIASYASAWTMTPNQHTYLLTLAFRGA